MKTTKSLAQRPLLGSERK